MIPLISVCIPTYERGDVLEQAINSVLNQTCENFELVISDNASGSYDIYERLKSYNDKRIKIIRQNTNIGMVKNFNACISQSSGHIIKPLCDDDLLHPECLNFIVENLLHDSNYQMVVVEGLAVNVINQPPWPVITSISQHKVQKGVRKDTLQGGAVTPTHVAFTRKLWSEIGPYNDSLKWSFDWDFIVRATSNNDILLLSTPLCVFRLWDGSSTVISKDILRNYRELHITLKHLLTEHPYCKKVVKYKIYSEVIKYFPTVIKHSLNNTGIFSDYLRISTRLVSLLK